MSKEKLKIIFVGDLVVPTGFGTVLHNIIKPNVEKFNITGLGVNYRGDPHDLEIPVFPAVIGGRGNIYGIDRLVDMLNGGNYDLLFILNDAWVIGYYLNAIKHHVDEKKRPKIIVYFPVDSLYHNPDWYKDFDIVSKAFTYTEFGKQVVKKCAPDLNIEIMFHGTNTKDFYQTYENKYDSRLQLFGEDLIKTFEGKPEETFIVLNANRNQPRKRLDITIEGFALFAKRKPNNVRLYMHTGAVDSSIDVGYIAKRFDIDDKIILTNLNRGVQRVSTDKLNLIYNACDVGINTSMGEGWGLTSTEHAVTGAAQIVPKHSACEELFSDCGLLIKTFANYTFDNSQTVGKLVAPKDVAKALNTLYEDRELLRKMASLAKEKFSKDEYNWEEIAKKWADIFEEVANGS